MTRYYTLSTLNEAGKGGGEHSRQPAMWSVVGNLDLAMHLPYMGCIAGYCADWLPLWIPLAHQMPHYVCLGCWAACNLTCIMGNLQDQMYTARHQGLTRLHTPCWCEAHLYALNVLLDSGIWDSWEPGKCICNAKLQLHMTCGHTCCLSWTRRSWVESLRQLQLLLLPLECLTDLWPLGGPGHRNRDHVILRRERPFPWPAQCGSHWELYFACIIQSQIAKLSLFMPPYPCITLEAVMPYIVINTQQAS